MLSELCKEEFLFRGSHRLDNKVFVMTEEEETSTGSTCLTCFEDIASINSWRKGSN
jgi:hypothetical protein